MKVGGVDVQHSTEVPRLVARHAPGTKLDVTVLRERSEKKLTVTLDALGDAKTERNRLGKNGPQNETPGIGAQIADAPNAGGAVVQSVVPGSAADEELQPGDVVIEANKQPVRNAQDLVKQVHATAKGEAVLLKVRREGRTAFVAVEKR